LGAFSLNVGLTESVEAITWCNHGYPKHRITFSNAFVSSLSETRLSAHTGPKGRHTVESRRIPTDTRTGLPWPEATPATLMGKPRSRFRDLS